jgi:ATP-binding cassette subfamily B protein
VTHRLSTIVHADTIFLLEGGQVREHGRHDELLLKNGAYADLWRKQGGFTIDDAGDEASVEVDRLRRVPILAGLDDDLLSSLRERFVTERYPPNRRVIVQGDPGNRFYIIVRGKVDVTFELPDGSERRDAVLTDGDHFGEVALLRDVPRTASVWTRSSCIFLALERDDFRALLQRAPRLHEALVRTYLERQGEVQPEVNSPQ